MAVATTPTLLLGSGPSMVPEPVLAALAEPTMGHLEPRFVAVMDDVAALLRRAFGTENRVTLPISGTGSAGMEAMVANFVAPGDRVVCGVHGVFGERMADELARHGAEVVRVEAEWGRAIEPERLIAAARDGLDAMVVVHGETSTGVAQPLDGLADACREHDALLLVDCVTSLTGHPLRIDESGIDVAFSGSQKCLNCPPGLAPLTAGPRAVAKLQSRAEPVPSWYFDLSMVLGYWRADGGARAYHHTAPTNMVAALRAALRLALDEEPMAARWARHARAHAALLAAVGTFGFARLAPAADALAPLLCATVPAGVDAEALRIALLTDHGIEVAAGIGPLKGRVLRFGVMGAGARQEPQAALVTALATVLGAEPRPALDALEAGWSVSA